ncbi:MAG: TIGR03621 family F420-dependent LLM class oxidoreductase [Acidimicrobiia bacterium]|nr:TIGR03621 family F420-dependent LLM class oxidoreductase [Acidimicrobiia bacterium]
MSNWPRRPHAPSGSTRRRAGPRDLGHPVTLLMPDHFGGQLALVPRGRWPRPTPPSGLTVGALVMCNDYRHPVVHAKEIATLDVLSEGRVEWGIGAGWMNTDYEQSGIAHDRAGVRIERLAEAVAVMKDLFADGPTDRSSTHYTISGLDGQPPPAQRPHPPLLIGGGGQRLLTLAGREADIVGIAPSASTGAVDATAVADAAAERTDRKLDWVRTAAGNRFADIELNALVFASIVTDDREGTAEQVGAAMGFSPEETLATPHALIGDVDQICESLEERRERWGFSYVVVQGPAMEAFAPVVERLSGT